MRGNIIKIDEEGNAELLLLTLIVKTAMSQKLKAAIVENCWFNC